MSSGGKMTSEEKKKVIKKLVGSGLGIAALLGIIYLVMRLLGWHELTREELQAFIEERGAVGPLIYIVISFLQVTFVPIPSTVTILAGNYVFGPLKAFLYSYIGLMAGGMVAFWLGRLVGRPFVNWVAGDKETAAEWIERLNGREKIVLFLMFLFPMFPDDLLCSVAGLFKYTNLEFFLMQLFTRAVAIGGTMLFMSGEVIPYTGWGIALIAVLVVLALVAFLLFLRHLKNSNSKK